MENKVVPDNVAMDDIGNKLNAVIMSHDAALKKLSLGRGNLLARAEKLKEMGAKMEIMKGDISHFGVAGDVTLDQLRSLG